MATELGKAYVQIIPSAKGISGSISSELSGEATAAGKEAGNSLVSTIKGVLAAAGLGAALKSALDAGGALQQSFGGLETLYGDAAEGAKQYAVEAAKAGISANSYAEQAVSFGAALKQAFSGDTAKAMESANTAILDMADNSAKMGTDIASIQTAYQGFAKQNYTMLDNLKLGYGGTKSEMERLLEDASKLSGVEYNIDNLGDVYDAIHVIQTDLGLTGVAAEEASETFSGSFGAMKASAENLMANLTLGEDIYPALHTLQVSVKNFLVNNLFPMVKNTISALPEVFSGALNIGYTLINSIADEIRSSDGGFEVVTGLVENILMWVPYLIEAALNLGSALFEGLVSYDWIGAMEELIANIKDNLDLAAAEAFGYDSFIVDDMLQGFLSGISEAIPTLIETAKTLIMALVNGIMQAIPQVITVAGTVFNTLLNYFMVNLPYIMEEGKNIILSLVRGIVDNLPSIIQSILQVVKTILATFIENLPQILEMGITIILELITGLIECLPDIIQAALDLIAGIIDTFKEINWGEVGSNLIQGIINGIVNAGSKLVEAAKNAAKAAFDAACNFLGIHSPATKGIYIGEMFDEGTAKGVIDNKDLVENAVEDLGASATSQLTLATQGASFDVSASTNSKIDILITLLSAYLPEIAKNKGISVNDLYNGINRELGLALL